MLQLAGIYVKRHAAHIVERSRGQIVTFDSRQALRKMQSSRTSEDHRLALVNSNLLIPLLVEISQFAAQGRMNVIDAKLEMVPEVRHRIFQVEHHAGSAGVEHFDD